MHHYCFLIFFLLLCILLHLCNPLPYTAQYSMYNNTRDTDRQDPSHFPRPTLVLQPSAVGSGILFSPFPMYEIRWLQLLGMVGVKSPRFGLSDRVSSPWKILFQSVSM